MKKSFNKSKVLFVCVCCFFVAMFFVGVLQTFVINQKTKTLDDSNSQNSQYESTLDELKEETEYKESDEYLENKFDLEGDKNGNYYGGDDDKIVIVK